MHTHNYFGISNGESRMWKNACKLASIFKIQTSPNKFASRQHYTIKAKNLPKYKNEIAYQFLICIKDVDKY